MTQSLSKAPRGFSTPPWAVQALLPHIKHLADGLEPAAGQGGISRVLLNNSIRVSSFDIYPYEDDDVVVNRRNFFSARWDDKYKALRASIKQRGGGIVSHPPAYLTDKFVRQALKLTDPLGTVALWASDRADAEYKYREFFAESDTFYKKIVPIQRLRLTNDIHEPMAWYIWRHGYGGAPTLHYEIV